MPDLTDPTPLDLDALEQVARAATPGPWRRPIQDEPSLISDADGQGSLLGLTADDEAIVWLEADAALIVAMRNSFESLLAELRSLRAAGEWKPFFFDDATPIKEGQIYLFAVPLSDDTYDIFTDAIVWDAETEADWRDGAHGWSISNVTHYREAVPSPPVVQT